MNPRNFFAELKRRNVYKVAVAYAVVGWLLLQAASILFPTFEAPSWVMKVFVSVIILGFPVALILAWAFELTPEGIKRTEDVLPNELDQAQDRAEAGWNHGGAGGDRSGLTRRSNSCVRNSQTRLRFRQPLLLLLPPRRRLRGNRSPCCRSKT